MKKPVILRMPDRKEDSTINERMSGWVVSWVGRRKRRSECMDELIFQIFLQIQDGAKPNDTF